MSEWPYTEIRIETTPELDEFTRRTIQDALDACDKNKSPEFDVFLKRTISELRWYRAAREYSPEKQINYYISSDNNKLLVDIGTFLEEALKTRCREEPEFGMKTGIEKYAVQIELAMYPGRVNPLFHRMQTRAQKPGRKPKISGKLAPASPEGYIFRLPQTDAPEGGDAA